MPTLPGIQSVPNGTPKEIRTFLTQMRERALATGNQFTDAEVAALKNLLNAPHTAGTTTPTTTTSNKTTFLGVPYKVYEGAGTAVWTKFKGSDAGIPDGATAVLIETTWTVFGKSLGELHSACLRVDTSKGNGANPWDDTFILTMGMDGKDSNLDAAGAFNQGVYPLAADCTFEYLTNVAGHPWTYLLIRVIGYQAVS